jgi:hypothetical protein
MDGIYGVTISEAGAALPCIALVGKLESLMNDMVSDLVRMVKHKTKLAGEKSLRMFLDSNVKADILQVLNGSFSETSSSAACKLGTFTSQVSANMQGFVIAKIAIAAQDKTVEYHIDLVKDSEN